MCGTCGNLINGREGLACRTLVVDILDSVGEIRLEPMRHLPVVRDLATDMAEFHRKIGDAVPDSSRLGAGIQAIEPLSKERKTIEPQRECIYCGLCYSACSIVGLDDEFLGPAALNRAMISILDSRTDWADEGVNAVANEEGLWRCHNSV